MSVEEAVRQILHSSYVVVLIGDEVCVGEGSRPSRVYEYIGLLLRAGIASKAITVCDDGLLAELAGGEDKVIELYGSTRRLRCETCGRRYTSEQGLRVCPECGGRLKVEVVRPSEPVPRRVLSAAVYEALTADTLLVVGGVSELPAALLAVAAYKTGVNVYSVTRRRGVVTVFSTHVDMEPERFLEELKNRIEAKSGARGRNH